VERGRGEPRGVRPGPRARSRVLRGRRRPVAGQPP
jgi:hypothetical protein